MSKPQILITDTAFVHDKHVHMLEAAGYQVVRLPKHAATEAELCHAIKGKAGYIVGGWETVTLPVLDAADALRAIVFTGNDYTGAIPVADVARQRGIKIGNAPDGPAHAVAEWALMATLLMTRRALELGRTGSLTTVPVAGIEGARIGIVGYGRVGAEIARMLQPFRPSAIHYYTRHDNPAHMQPPFVHAAPLDEVLAGSDIVFLCVSSKGNEGWFDAKKMRHMRPEALLVDITHTGVVDEDDMFAALQRGAIRAAVDRPSDQRFNDLPLSRYFCSNESTAFYTTSEIDLTSTLVVEEMIRLLDIS